MSRVEVVKGNQAAALGVRVSRPDVIAAYPITPQSPLVEYLGQYVADGELDSAMSEVESEHSAMSILQGASLAGSRTFTATSSQGLALMYEPYFRTPTLRLPVVMAIVNREMISPQTVWGGPQDSLTLRDAGWIQLYVENNQEIFDTIVQAFRIAEDPDVLLPVNVCYDGFYLSHMTEPIQVPDQQVIDEYLPPYEPTHIRLDPDDVMSVDPLTPGHLLMEYRQRHMQAQRQALRVIEEANDEYRGATGRSWGGLLDSYRLQDAEAVLITLGSMTGAARVAVDAARERGMRVGLLKIRALRPFPTDEVRGILADRRAYAVVDRNVSFGLNTGIVYQEILAALSGQSIPGMNYIGGLGGEDLTVDMFSDVLEQLGEVAGGAEPPRQCQWLFNPERSGSR